LCAIIHAPYSSIIATSHTQKLTIIKNIFHDLGYNDLGYFYADQIFDPKRWQKLLDREKIGREEQSFALLYFIHLRQ
jgi:hypothetical protein